jgi:hypothetical protein
METMRRDQEVVTRPKLAFAFSLDPKTGRSRDKQDPLVPFLNIRFVHWRRLASRDYPLDSYALALEQLREEFPVRLTWEVIEEIDHSDTLSFFFGHQKCESVQGSYAAQQVGAIVERIEIHSGCRGRRTYLSVREKGRIRLDQSTLWLTQSRSFRRFAC